MAAPGTGTISPADISPLAERTGLILPLGRWVLEEACRQLAGWQASAATHELTLAVNVSVRQFHHPDFVEEVESVLRATGAIGITDAVNRSRPCGDDPRFGHDKAFVITNVNRPMHRRWVEVTSPRR